eukprot:Gb_03711 [translate_table: standard]
MFSLSSSVLEPSSEPEILSTRKSIRISSFLERKLSILLNKVDTSPWKIGLSLFSEKKGGCSPNEEFRSSIVQLDNHWLETSMRARLNSGAFSLPIKPSTV